MNHPSYRILVADDEDHVLQSVKTILSRKNYEIDTATNGFEALEKLGSDLYSVFLVDLTLQDVSAIEILKKVKKRNILTQTVVFSGKGSQESAEYAIKYGAYDYLTKPVKPNRLNAVIANAIERHQAVSSNKQLKEESRALTRYGDIIGQSTEMQEIYLLIDAVADSTANVVISGESGTGKELIAKAIHKKGNRAEKPFVAVNCSAFPNEILENELFGHEEGAFTGAIKEKAGCFELANHGTLFLDEICDMPLGAQAKILRVLEERCFRRLGGKKEIAIDVRVICASNKNMEEAVVEKKLREDLFYRLHVIEIDVPRLRERTGDLTLLMVDFLKKFSKKNGRGVLRLSSGAEDVLYDYHWPGNVRELKNTIERAVVLSHGESILVEHLPKRITHSENNKNEFKMPVGSKLEDVERELIFHTLQHTHNNKTKAAQVLGVSLKTLHNKLNLYQSQGFLNVNST